MIAVSTTKAYTEISFPTKSVYHIAERVCHGEGVKKAELSFVIVNDGRIRRINKRFLKHDYVTDVITFPLETNGVNAEIYINSQQAQRQAKEIGISVKNEMTRLVVHGTLHAIGYDDSIPSSKKKMDKVQERYVAELSLQ